MSARLKEIAIFSVVIASIVMPGWTSPRPDRNKMVSIEIFRGKYFTYNAGSRPQLPFDIWRAGGRIIYEFIPHVLFSLEGGYAYTKDFLYLCLGHLYLPSEFSLTNAAFVCAYKNRVLPATDYSIGTGINISYAKLFSRSQVFHTTYLSPIIIVGMQWHLISPIYLNIQCENSFHSFVKISSREVHLRRILPSLSIGSGCSFRI